MSASIPTDPAPRAKAAAALRAMVQAEVASTTGKVEVRDISFTVTPDEVRRLEEVNAVTRASLSLDPALQFESGSLDALTPADASAMAGEAEAA